MSKIRLKSPTKTQSSLEDAWKSITAKYDLRYTLTIPELVKFLKENNFKVTEGQAKTKLHHISMDRRMLDSTGLSGMAQVEIIKELRNARLLVRASSEPEYSFSQDLIDPHSPSGGDQHHLEGWLDSELRKEEMLSFKGSTTSLYDTFIEYISSLESLPKSRDEFAESLVVWYDNLLENNDYPQNELGRRTILEEAAEQRLEAVEDTVVGHFKMAKAKLGLSEAEVQASFNRVRAKLFSEDEALDAQTDAADEYPQKAPTLYKERADRSQRPDEFIRDTYPEWVSRPKAFPRSVFNEIDPPLYTAISRYGLSEELSEKFPKSVGRTKKFDDMSDAAVLERKRQRDREASKRHRERSRKAKM